MKKLISITVLLIFIFSLKSVAQCTSCDQSTIDYTKNASGLGQHNTATGQASFVLGSESKSLGVSSGAFGIHSEAYAAAGFAIGRRIKSAATSAIILGTGYNFTDYLINGTYNSLMIGFNSTAPTLFISESPANDTHKDRTGLIGIGNVTDPQAKLHLRADAGEEAAMFIEPSDWDGGNSAVLYLGNKQNEVSANAEDGLVYTTQKNHIFKGGDVYIEEIDKGIIMKSPDGKCWRGTLDNSGSLHFNKLDACPGNTVSVYEHKRNPLRDVTVYPNPADNILTVKINRNDIPKNKKLKVVIINQHGTEVMSKYMNGSSIGFFTGDLVSGSYFIKITDGHNAITKQFIKK